MFPGRRRPAADQPGGSTLTRYRELRRASRLRRWPVQAGVGLVLGALGWAVYGPAGGLGTAAVGAGLVAAYQWWSGDEARWRRDAQAERRTAWLLRSLRSAGYVLLHDRTLPGSRETVDHLAVGPAGVFLVDTRGWDRRTRITQLHGEVWIGATAALRVVGPLMLRTQQVANAIGQAAETAVEVIPVMAVHGARLPWRGVSVEGVPLLRAVRVPRYLRAHPPLFTPEQVTVLAEAAARALPAP